MAYKDLQVHVDNSQHCIKRLHVAAEVAAGFGAHLTGVFVRSPLYLPNYSIHMNAEWLSSVEDNFKRITDAKESAAHKVFDEVMAQYQVDAEWRPVTGDMYASLAEEAGYADLLVLGQPEPEEEKKGALVKPDHVLLTAGRPCLVVPYIGAAESVAKHPLIAWNGSRESNRALHDALPLLERAETVTVMLSDMSGFSENQELPDTRIARHLARHDVKVMTKTLTTKERHISNAFLSYLADNGHDLLVMGAYGHSRFREVVLGGMTHEVMQQMTVPVFMSH